MNNISYSRKSLFKKLSAFQVYLIRMHSYTNNSEEKKTFIFHIYCMLQIFFKVKKYIFIYIYIYIYIPNLTGSGTLRSHFIYAIENN